MNRIRAKIAAIATTAVVACVVFVGIALASPTTVNLTAGTCSGQGSSTLPFPQGIGATTGCSGSSRYLSSTVCLVISGCSNLMGNWYASDVQYSSGNATDYAVSVASTHNLQYILIQNGFVGTSDP